MSQQEFRLAVIGAGRWGMNHIKTAFKTFGSSFVAVGDLSPKAEEAVEAAAPGVRFTSDLEAIYNDPSITAVIIATPAETHYDVARMCMENSKDVLVEKPITLYSSQARELQALAKQRSRILMVGHLLLFHPAIRKIKQLIDDGAVGKLQYIYSNRLNLGAIRKEENILWSFAPHDISVLQYLIGTDPISVDAKGATFIQPGIHDVTLTILNYPNNIHAHIFVSWLNPFKEQRLVIMGDKSMIVFEDTKKEDKLLLYPKGFTVVNGIAQKREEETVKIQFQSDEPLQTEQEHFAMCVRERKEPLTDGENGIKVLQILEQAQAKL
jgi:UDP-2-acetamido-3-amino-2,3-dideoxy-glucuronate N-acetyltransferase